MPKFTKHLTGSAVATELISQLEGDRYITQPLYYDDGARHYTHIAGVIVFPDFQQRGYILTVGVERDTEFIHCIEEYSSDMEHEIIDRAKAIQKEYGCLDDWYGDPEALLTIITEDDDGLILTPFIDSDMDDALQTYVTRIRAMMPAKAQKFFIHGCDGVRNAILSFSKQKSKAEENPVLFAVGGLLHSLLVIKPWERAYEQIELVPTTIEDWQEYEDKQHEKEFLSDLFA